VPVGVVQSRAPDDARQEKLLFLIQARRKPPEVVSGGRLYAVGARTVVDGVQVELQDLVLGVSLLHAPGEKDRPNLPSQALLFVPEEGVVYELLGYGAAALHHLTRLRVSPKRATNPNPVDPMVLVEAFVLDGHQA
jgi:hypothetical protein